MSKSIWNAILSLGGLGYLPKMPGTWGSLGGLVFWSWLLFQEKNHLYLGLLVAVVLLGWISICAKGIQEDESQIVIDEFIGIGIAVWPSHHSYWQLALAFILFRAFDILKPPGVSFFDQRFLAGWGILLDDVVAGIYAAVLIGVLNVF